VQEVKAWAEQIILASQARAGYRTDVVQDAPAGSAAASGSLPPFVAHRGEKEDLPDGRHRVRWFLLDAAGHAHLAVTGEEKDTRDGHYSYHTEPAFDRAAPLAAGNQDAVKRWLDAMVVHPGEAPRPAGGKAVGRPRGGGGGGGAPGAPHRGPGRPPRPGSARAGQKHHWGGGGDSLLKQATANLAKRAKASWRGADPDQEARELVAAELRRWGQEEAVRREAAKRAALAYAVDPPTERERAMVARCAPVLAGAGAAGALPPPGGAGTPAQRAALVATLGALRELGHAHAALEMVAHPGVGAAVGALKGHPHPQVAAAAGRLAAQWLRGAVAAVWVLGEPRYVQDPRPGLEDT
jgi:hypothetical protein